MRLSRRGFIAALAACLGAACSRKFMLVPAGARDEDGQDLPMPHLEVDQLPDGVSFREETAIPLSSPGRPILVTMRPDGAMPWRVAIVRDPSGALLAFVAECPDLGTPLRPRRTGHIAYWQAAHHGSRFAFDGSRVLRGPARHLPRRLLVQSTAGTVVVRNLAP